MKADVFFLTLVGFSLLLAGVRCVENEETQESDSIVGGVVAPKGLFPYIVYFKNSQNRFFCSGTLITPLKVLTSANCFRSYLNPVGVVAIMNTVSTTPDADRVWRNVIRVAIPSDYNPANEANNLAIVTLDSPVYSVPVVKLGFGVYPPVGVSSAIVAGWGYSEPTYVTPFLRYSYTTVQRNSLCSAALGNNPVLSSSFFICVATPRVGSCTIDNGGPVFYGGRQVGIMIASRCGGGDPIAASSVAAYERWIRTYGA